LSKKAILIITDGIGFSEKSEFNAFQNAETPTYDYLFKNIPYGMVPTHGLSVGLPDGQMGNSEVGHMTIGSGRVLYQDLVKISQAIESGELERDKKIEKALESSRVHLIGLFSDGGVHSHINHLFGLIEIVIKSGKKAILHLVTDGRDVSPKSAKIYLEKLASRFGESIEIASIGGRFYTMDRDKRWDRVEKGYRAVVEASPKSELSVYDYIDLSYSKGETDEFIIPTAFRDYNGVEDGDSIIFYNFRSDRMREIVEAVGCPAFSEFKRDKKDIYLITATSYREDFQHPILFEKESPKNGLSETVSKYGLSQLHTAETEKYAHVTFFFNGGVEEPFLNESRLLIPSPKVQTYDLQPEMSAKEVTDGVLKGMEFGYDLIVVNYANGDMVGHTGVFDAGVKAVETVDRELGRVLERAKERDYSVVLTSDHGNCEEMRDGEGNTLTNHTVGDVWCFVASEGVEKVENGGLNRIAPTVLKVMDLPIPEEMDRPLV
jgi:2,3-bisphosphoglycerate-independent phosphoglycerate mutase